MSASVATVCEEELLGCCVCSDDRLLYSVEDWRKLEMATWGNPSSCTYCLELTRWWHSPGSPCVAPCDCCCCWWGCCSWLDHRLSSDWGCCWQLWSCCSADTWPASDATDAVAATHIARSASSMRCCCCWLTRWRRLCWLTTAWKDQSPSTYAIPICFQICREGRGIDFSFRFQINCKRLRNAICFLACWCQRSTYTLLVTPVSCSVSK